MAEARTKEDVALDLTALALKAKNVTTHDEILDLYVKCLKVVNGTDARWKEQS
jgi:hypothetical protein